MAIRMPTVAARHRARGFTLVELVITFIVLTIVAAFAAPSFSQFIASQRVRGAATDLASAVTLTRSEAVKRNATTDMSSTTTTWAGGWAISAGTERVRAYGPYSGIKITTAGGTTLSVGNDGRPLNGGQSFQVSPSSSTSSTTVCVQVSGTGRVATVSGTCP